MVSAKFASLLAVASAALVAAAPAPLKKRADIDTVILQYALFLEHLEATFYHQSIDKLSEKDFADAGYGPWVRERFMEIGGQELEHVKFLTKALGSDAIAACEYEFGVTDVKSFVATSQLLEGVGVSAYLGAAANITNPAYLTAAGSILTVEGRHSAWVQSTAALSDPAGSSFDVPTNFNQTYSLAAPLVKSCPKSNAALPVVAFPALTITPADGQWKLAGKGVEDGQYLATISAEGTSFTEIKNGEVATPKQATGRSYYLVTKGNKAVTDDDTVAGPVAMDNLPTADEAAKAVASQYS